MRGLADGDGVGIQRVARSRQVFRECRARGRGTREENNGET